MTSPFLLTLCQPGAEAALKSEAMRAGLKPAFQRPGLVTLKRDRDITLDDLATAPPFVFARHVALSLGAIEGDVGTALPDALLKTGARRLHVVALAEDEQPAADEIRAKLLETLASSAAGAFHEGEDATGAELVATVVLVDARPWLSLHRAHAARTPFPGGRPRLTLPPEAPSRAWLKLEEAARLFEIPFQAGERAVEIGSAPGGATHALLERGLEVIGVDPNEMDPRIASHPRFAHLRMTSMNVDVKALQPFQWLLLDVNVPPRTALSGALPFVKSQLPAGTGALRGFVFTLKMKDGKIAEEVDDWLARIRGVVGPAFVVRARQLWSNGREICVQGLRVDPRVSSSGGVSLR